MCDVCVQSYILVDIRSILICYISDTHIGIFFMYVMVCIMIEQMIGGTFAGYTARAWVMRENRRPFTWTWDWTLEDHVD